MKWMYGIVLIFSLLTIFFLYGDYKKKAMPAKTFVIVSVLEGVIALLSLILLLR